MFFSVAVASFVKRMCLIDYPLVVPGFSTAGAGQLIALRRHQGRLEDAPHLRARKGYKWPDLIPKFYSVHTFFAESAFSALHATGRSDLILKFNLPALYALCILLYPKWLSATLHSIRLAKQSTCQNLIQFQACFVSSILKLLVKLTQKRVDALSLRPGRAKLETEITGVNDTKEAMQALSGYLNRKGKIFDDSPIQ